MERNRNAQNARASEGWLLYGITPESKEISGSGVLYAAGTSEKNEMTLLNLK